MSCQKIQSQTFQDVNLPLFSLFGPILDEVMRSEFFLKKLDKRNFARTHVGGKFLNDNCYFFSAEKVLVSMAKYHLERGHISCKKCDKGGVGSPSSGTIII